MLRHFMRYRKLCTAIPIPTLADKLTTTIEGIDKDTVQRLLQSVPSLGRYSPEQWRNAHTVLAAEGIDSATFLSIIAGNPAILRGRSETLVSSLHCWRACQFGDTLTKTLLATHPSLLELTEHGPLAQRVSLLHSYFETRKNVWRLFLNNPNLVVDDQKDIERKIDYVLEKMRIEVAEVVKSNVFCHDLSKIRCRHVFLERAGIFKRRSPKAQPGDSCSNPKLYQIVDTSDKRFATKVAYVTLEEYEVFQELYERREGRESDEMETDEEDEMEDENGGYRKTGSKRAK